MYFKTMGKKKNHSFLLLKKKKAKQEYVCLFLSMSRDTPKRCFGWEANVTHGVTQKAQGSGNFVLKLFLRYLACKVETRLFIPEMPCLKGNGHGVFIALCSGSFCMCYRM